MKKRGTQISLLVLVLSSLPLRASPLKVIRIGLASNFTDVASNSYNAFGNSVRNGARLALQEINARLKKKGIQVNLVELDYGSNLLKVSEVANEATRSDLVAVMGYEFSDEALLAAPVHHAAHLAMITPSASADRLSTFGNYVHQGTFNNSFQGEALARFASQKLKAKRVALIVAADCAYCQDMAHAFIARFEKRGGKISKNLSVLTEDRDFSSVIENLNSDSFDAVIVPNQEMTSFRIISALLKAGIYKPSLGGDGWRTLGKDFFSKTYNKSFKGYMTAHWSPELPSISSHEFIKKYKKAYGRSPSDSAVLAYDSLGILGRALEASARYDRESVEKALKDIKKYDGVSGRFLFNDGAVPKKTVLMMRSTPSGFAIEETLNPEEDQ